jgi:hypothetical protein
MNVKTAPTNIGITTVVIALSQSLGVIMSICVVGNKSIERMPTVKNSVAMANDVKPMMLRVIILPSFVCLLIQWL